MKKIDFSGIIQQSKEIQSGRNYWLVRTMGGDYYSNFVSKGYIAIGFNEIKEEDLKFVNTFHQAASEKLTEILISRSEVKSASYFANQLIKFYRDIKKNDVVIVPSTNSAAIAIGIVESTNLISNVVKSGEDDCPFEKRKKVKWLKTYDRKTLNPKMQLLFSSRHIISNINDYSVYIDSSVNDFYIKDGKSFLVLKVKSQDDVSATDFSAIFDLFDILDEFSSEHNIPSTSNDIKLKLNVQSPGDIVMSSLSPEGVAIIGMLIVLINGGGLKIQKLGLDLSTSGLIKSISDFLDRRKDRKFREEIRSKIEHMDIDDPNDLVEILKTMNKTRNKF